MTAGNDTVTGTSATYTAGDAILDYSTTDNDTLNLTLTAANTATPTVQNVENININWNSYNTAGADLTGITGSKAVTFTTSKAGSLGNLTLDDAAFVTNVVAGAGFVGTVAVNQSRSNTNLTADLASAVSLDTDRASQTGAVVNAAAATTVTVTDFGTATVNAGYAGSGTLTVNVDDAGKSSNAITVNVKAAKVTIGTGDGDLGTDGMTGTLTINSSASAATITHNGAIGEALVIAGTGDVTLLMDGDEDGAVITNDKESGTLTVKTSSTAANDLSEVQADLVWFTGAAGAITALSGTSLKFSADSNIDVTVEGTGTADVINATSTNAAVGDIDTDGVETLNYVAAATAKTGIDQTIDSVTLATGVKMVITGTNDLKITAMDSAGTVDASGLTGDLTANFDGDNAQTAMGATGDNTITADSTTKNFTYTGSAGDDAVTVATTTGAATLVLGDGDNTVTATGAIATNGALVGALVVTAGAGDDEVAVRAITSGVLNLNLGDGDNSVTVDGASGTPSLTSGIVTITTGSGIDEIAIGLAAAPEAKITVNAGAGDDTITLNDGVTWASGSRLIVDGGEGDDTLVLPDDTVLTSATVVTLSNIEYIQIADAASAATFKAATLSGATYEIMAADDVIGATFDVVSAATTTTIDLSGLTINREVGSAVVGTVVSGAAADQGVAITGTKVADTITGSDYGDTIVAGNGADSVRGDGGNDTITLTETTVNSAVDTVVFEATASDNGVDTIIGFRVGKDILDLLTYAALDGATFHSDAPALGTSVIITNDDGTDPYDIVELTTTLSSRGNLDNATDGSELLKAMSSTATAATITVAQDNDMFALIAYQNGNAYVYYADAAGDTNLTASEITLVAVLTGITAGTLSGAEFTEV